MRKLLLFLAFVSFSSLKAQVQVENPVRRTDSIYLTMDYLRVYQVRVDSPDTLDGLFAEYWFGNEVVRGKYSNHQPEGKWIFRYQNGAVQRTMEFRNGVFEGAYYHFYNNGDTLASLFFRNGKREGVQKMFHPGHVLRTQETFVDGKPVGESKSYDKSGVLTAHTVFTDGYRDRTLVLYYSNGNKKQECRYVKGEPEGICISYWENGTVKEEMEYRNGQPWNLLKSLDSKGNKNTKRGKVSNGSGMLRILNEDGLVLEENFYKNGKKDSLCSNYLNGNLYRKTMFRDGMRNGLSVSYFENGKIDRESQYLNDTLSGKETAYWENRKVKENGEYKSGKKVAGTWKYYDKKGGEIDPPYGSDSIRVNLPRLLRQDFPGTKLSHDSFMVAGGTKPELTYAEIVPEFPGGEATYFAYLRKNVRYPQFDKENNIQGTCYVSFVVNNLGLIEQCKIAKGVSPGLDKESAKLVKSMPTWSPGYMGTMPVNVWLTQPVRFVLQ